MEHNSRPNLFRFATSELSQDAFLCWLVDHGRERFDAALYECARAFVAHLYGLEHPGRGVCADWVTKIQAPVRQYQHIDILFNAVIAGRTVTFVIEDKVETTKHDDQLARYREIIKAEQRSDEDIRIYLKTGSLFDEDRDAEADEYHVIGPEDLLAFLDSHESKSDIYRDFRENLRERVSLQRESLRALFEDGTTDSLKFAHVQWAMMQKIVESIGAVPERGNPYRGHNLDGRPWTQFRFIELADALAAGIGENIFYRLDARKNPRTSTWSYYLAARQYAKVKGNEAAVKVKRERLDGYRQAFSKAIQSLDGSLIPSPPSRGVNESEIGTVFLGEGGNSVHDILKRWPELHRCFILEAEALGLVPIAQTIGT